MSNKIKIFIIGTSHSLQCGTSSHSSDQIANFIDFVKELCQTNNIKCIIEEMSNRGLLCHNTKKTIPSIIANDLDIDYHPFDLDEKQLGMLKISPGEIVSYSRNISKQDLLNDTIALLTNKLQHSARERYWLTSILSVNSWPTLFICGSDHAQNMQDLINSIGIGPVLSWYNLCPEKRLCCCRNSPYEHEKACRH